MFRRIALAALLVAGCSPTPKAPSTQGSAPASSPATTAPPSIAGRVVWTPETTRQPSGVVYVEDAARDPSVATTVTIAVKNKDLTPFVAVMATGGTATFANRDALTHHVFSPELPGWDTGYLGKDQTTTKRFDSPGAYSLLCNIHPEMLSYLVVVPSTAFGIVGRDGRYAIASLPPGNYRLRAWGPRMQPVTQSVTVGTSGTARADFELHPAASQP